MSSSVHISFGKLRLAQLMRPANLSAARSIGIYTFTNFFGKAASFLLLFVFTNPIYISPAENGLLSLFSTALLFLMPFLSMGLLHSTSTDFFRLNRSDFKNSFSTGFVMAFVVMCLSCGLLFTFRHQLAAMYGYPLKFCWLIPVITFLSFCNEQFLSIVRSNNEPITYFKANALKILLELGLSLCLVVLFAWRWEGRVTGILLAYSITACYAFWYFYRNGYLPGKIVTKVVKDELIFAIPIVAMQVSLFCMAASDKFFLSAFTNDNNETVGIYGIATVFASIILVLSAALIQYIFPKVYQQLSKAVPDFMVIRKLFWIYFTVMLAGTLMIAACTPLAYQYVVSKEYAPALGYIFILFAGYFTWAIAYFFYSFLLFYKERRKLMWLAGFSIVGSLAINYFFIRNGGAMGAAVAVLITYVSVLFGILYFTSSYWKKMILPGENVIGVNEIPS